MAKGKRSNAKAEKAATGSEEQAFNESHPPAEQNDQQESKASEPKKAKRKSYVVAKEFRDHNDFSQTWKEGDDVSHFDQDRLQHLIDTGIVEEK
jgi:hypothetical protein